MHPMARYVCQPYLTVSAKHFKVQGEAQGSEEALKDFVNYLHKGPSAASVSKVDQSEISTKSGESGFSQK
jgi:acylphosphatase